MSTNRTVVYLVAIETVARAESLDRRENLVLKPLSTLEVRLAGAEVFKELPHEGTHRRALFGRSNPDSAIDVMVK